MLFLSILLVASASRSIQADETTLTEEERKCVSSWDICLHSNDTKAIVGEGEIDITEAPFQVQIEISTIFNWQMFCAGSIIQKNVVLTAGHCVYRSLYDLSLIRVLSGSAIAGKGNIHNVEKIIVHPQYDKPKFAGDIGLVKVSPKFSFSSSVKPIGFSFVEPKDGLQTMIAGWGDTSGDFVSPSKKLKRITLPVMNRKICNAVYKIIAGDEYHFIDPSKICAGTPSMVLDACKGDSGGALYFDNTIYGVLSYGAGCEKFCRPKILTNVAYYGGWIEEQILKINSETLTSNYDQ